MGKRLRGVFHRLLGRRPLDIPQQYHRRHAEQAQGVLRDIESARGKTDPGTLRVADEYAREVLGWEGYAPWLHVYAAFNGSFKTGWIPDNYYGKIVLPAWKGAYGRIADLNCLTGKLFGVSIDGNMAGGFFPDIAYLVNGVFLSAGYELVKPQRLQELLFAENDRVVFKVDNSCQGRGVFFFDRASFDPMDIIPLGNGVFQSCVEQHDFFNALVPGSVATLRVTTVVTDDGDPSVRACYLRLGRSHDSHVKSLSHVRIPVDLESGVLGEYGYLTTWLPTDKHPDTDVPFRGLVIPAFDKCLECAAILQRLIPFARCVGWDMAVDRAGRVQVLEWNGAHNDIKFSEATQGPCFADLGWENLWKISQAG